MAIEEPKYSVALKAENYEVRKYGPIIVAEVKVESDFKDAGNKGFRILAGYIFGKNKSKSKISMTAPVSQQVESEKISMTAPVTLAKSTKGYLVQFTMPDNYTLQTLPTPNDKRVHLRELLERKIAVYSYTGSWSEARYKEKLANFTEDLKKDKIITTGEPVLARFDSPFKLWFLRRNEIWIDVKN